MVRFLPVGVGSPFQVMSLLQECFSEEPGSKDQIRINAGQIEEIDFYLAGNGINGFIGIGEGVNKGL